MRNFVLISKKNRVIVEQGNGKQSWEKVMTACANFTSYGYVFSENLIGILQTLTDEQFDEFILMSSEIIKKNLGAHKKYNPMYPNFPKQVMDAHFAELYWNAILHYLFGLIPDYDEAARPELDESLRKCKVLELGSYEDYCSVIRNLISSNTSISSSDKRDISYAILELKNVQDVIPATIPFKENLAYVASEFLDNNKSVEQFVSLFNNVTDVLRVAVSLSGGDVSLSKNTRFKNFSRKVRKIFLSAIDSLGNLEEDMLRHEGMWIRLGERLHPGEFSKEFPTAFSAFNSIRNHKNGTVPKIVTFNSKVEINFLSNDIKELVKLLKTRPGMFARRLDQLLRIDPKKTKSILTEFEKVTEQISTPVLLQIHSHFANRGVERLAFPKGDTTKFITLDPSDKEISEKDCMKVLDICEKTLIKKFSKLSPLGKVYIDPILEKVFIPQSQRTASRALKSLARGSRIPFGNKKFVRFFMWWKNTNEGGRVDLDLSAAAFDSNWNTKPSIWYGNLKDGYGCHSGDITSAPNGACEFIDIDIAKALKQGVRYIQLSVNNYTGQKFTELPEAFAGFMERDNQEAGKIFDARTVMNKIDLTSESTASIPLIIDLETREIIWSDFGFQKGHACMNVRNNAGKNIHLGKAVCEMKRFSMYDLFKIHAVSRGTIVYKKEEADIVYSIDGNVTPYDFDVVASEYLS